MFKDKFLSDLEKHRLKENRLWIFLKLESVKLLKDLDIFTLPELGK
jgi:hypothetical protein